LRSHAFLHQLRTDRTMQQPMPIATHAAEAPPLRFRLLWRALGWGFVALVIYLSLTSDPPDLGGPEAFDAGHVVAYFWLMFWFAQIHHAGRARLMIAAGFLALGVALEFIQGTTGYRTFDYADMARNALGVGIGLALARTRLQHMLTALEAMISGS
jgi:hypothetical protein